ncbi:CrcB-like protein-domain-containing protein [Phaeosphaeria sp. MPI-PUGE-AT-0046c]|nr:CrcB-like protein-domain-containing protein [Phaeosphaeria sp. MPI-PUGE-AT-0046c]
MADMNNNNKEHNNDDEDPPTKRQSHFNQQRSSLRSSNRSSGLTTRSRPQSQQRLNDFALGPTSPDRADSETLESPASPAPNVPFTRSRASSNTKGKSISRPRTYSSRGRSQSGPDDAKKLDELSAPTSWENPYQLLAQPSPIPLQTGSNGKTRSRHSSFLLGRLDSASRLDITALPSITTTKSKMDPYTRSKLTPSAQRASRIATELYTVSYLIFFSIWGTLARLGLQALTFYPGAPVVFSELWANVAGTFVLGFLAEDRQLFHSEWGIDDDKLPEPSTRPVREQRANEKQRHGKVKKTIPLYIGLATGFCGSFTSFSSFVRDVFLSLSNDLRAPNYHPSPSSLSTVPRHSGYSVLAILSTITITMATCFCALKAGAHLALLLDRVTPSLPFRLTRRFIDPLFVLLGWGCWFGAAFMTIFPPSSHDDWRSQALFALVFAPFGCIARHYISIHLNTFLPSFPLGTFAVNIFGTAVLAMSYDLQRVPLAWSGVVGGSVLGCQVLQGIQDGFCGALTTVSTWISEIEGIKKLGRKYVYGLASVATGLGTMVIIMGSVRWTIGWGEIVCRT